MVARNRNSKGHRGAKQRRNRRAGNGNGRNRPLLLQKVKGFQANIGLIKGTFGKSGVPGCVEVVRTAVPAIQERIDVAIADGWTLKRDWRPVFVAKAADELTALKVPNTRVLEFKKQAAEALGLKI